MADDARALAPGKLPGDMLGRLISRYRTPPDDSVLVSAAYGYDAAAVTVGGETVIVKSDPITFATSDAARYVVAVNANDLACLGAVPRWMTVVGLLPDGSTTPELVESLFADLRDACVAENISLIGGHTEITIGLDRPILVGTLLGTPGEHGLLHPGHASEGDELFVTKTVGIEGTSLLASEREPVLRDALGAEVVTAAKALIISPGISVTRDARLALASGVATALHDPTEGGVATAVHEIADASGLGATIRADDIPILPETRLICEHLGLDPLGLLSSGALLIAAKPGSEPAIQAAFAGSGIPVSHIGGLTARENGHTIVRGEMEKLLPRFDSDELARALTS